MTVLWRISSAHLCAGLVVRDGVVVETAPILARVAQGRRWADVRARMARWGWHGEPVGEVGP